MRLGAFELVEPLPELRDPHAMVMIRPWVDVGSVGSLTLRRLERHFRARPLGKLARPGTFFDFTRYRPTVRMSDGKREMTYPNSHINYASPESGPDLLFLHLLEPHAMSEDYIESIAAIFKQFTVSVYCRLGAMYDSVPHTRPIAVTGSPSDIPVRDGATPRHFERHSSYEGPTTVMNMLLDAVTDMGVKNISFMAHLPHYAQMDEDYAGTARMLEALSAYYEFPTSIVPAQRAKRQYSELEAATEAKPELKSLVARLEAYYDSTYETKPAEQAPELSPEIERFLRGLDSQL